MIKIQFALFNQVVWNKKWQQNSAPSVLIDMRSHLTLEATRYLRERSITINVNNSQNLLPLGLVLSARKTFEFISYFRLCDVDNDRNHCFSKKMYSFREKCSVNNLFACRYIYNSLILSTLHLFFIVQPLIV